MLAGIAGGMTACLGGPTPRRQERLLYVSISVLIVNTVCAVLTEWTFYQHRNTLLAHQLQLEENGEDAKDDRGFNNVVAYGELTDQLIDLLSVGNDLTDGG